MLRLFFGLVASGLSSVSVMVLVLGTLNVVTGWNLHLSINHSVIELPQDMISVLVITAILTILAGGCWSVAHFERLVAGIKARPLLALGGLLGVAASLYGAYYLMAGGALGTALDRNDVAAVRRALGAAKVPQEKLNSYLYQALRNGHLEAAGALVDAGADPNRVSGEHASSLLIDACIWFPKPSVVWLLERGGKPDLQDKFGRTAAMCMLLYRLSHQAADGEAGLVEILEQLASHGAHLDIAASDGDTLLKVSQKNHQAQVEAWLLARPKAAE